MISARRRFLYIRTFRHSIIRAGAHAHTRSMVSNFPPFGSDPRDFIRVPYSIKDGRQLPWDLFFSRLFYVQFLTHTHNTMLLANSKSGSLRRPRRRIGEMSQSLQRELMSLSTFDRADIRIRVSTKMQLS